MPSLPALHQSGLASANLTYSRNRLALAIIGFLSSTAACSCQCLRVLKRLTIIKRKRALDKAKTSEAKKRRVQWKVDRVKDAERRKERTKKHGCRNFRVRIH